MKEPSQRGLFAGSAAEPLASRMRPRTLDEFIGQERIVGPGRLLRRAIQADQLSSVIFYGPPGTGKTTLARVIANTTKADFLAINAVLAGVKDIREAVAHAQKAREAGRRTILFVDEVHRFNKAQQDALLPHVEAGTITLIGATTENPSFSVNAALLSRCKTFRLEPLKEDDLVSILRRALSDRESGLGSTGVGASDEALRAIARLARGDARRALTILESAVAFAAGRGDGEVTLETLVASEEKTPLLYDKAGEEHYNVVSAFIKSMRGSDPDAAVYWMMRMLEAGDDPLFILRRMLIFASEDVGLADPRALVVVASADEAFRRMGMPEGIYPLTQAALYLACAPKSNAVKNAWQRAKALVEERGALPVPMKLRNAVTKLMKQEGYGVGYRYAHDYDGGVVPGETYLPDELVGQTLYEPTDRGEEARIRARLAALRKPPETKGR